MNNQGYGYSRENDDYENEHRRSARDYSGGRPYSSGYQSDNNYEARGRRYQNTGDEDYRSRASYDTDRGGYRNSGSHHMRPGYSDNYDNDSSNRRSGRGSSYGQGSNAYGQGSRYGRSGYDRGSSAYGDMGGNEYRSGSAYGRSSGSYRREDSGYGYGNRTGRGFSYGNDYDRYSEGRRGYQDDNRNYDDRDDRGFWDKAGDEIASWFGDDEARARRERDHRMDDRDNDSTSYRGKGPKNYKRSDDRIREDVNDRLSDDPYLDASDIDVSVEDSDVVLSGTVKSRSDKRHAEDLAERVSGVSNVENRIRVTSSGMTSYNDTEYTSGVAVPDTGDTTDATASGNTSSSTTKTGTTATGTKTGTTAKTGTRGTTS